MRADTKILITNFVPASLVTIATLLVTIAASSAVLAAPGRRDIPHAAGSAWHPRVETRLGATGYGELYVNDRLIMRLRTRQGGLLPIQRAEVTAGRLQDAIADGLSPAGIVADTTSDPHTPRLKGGGRILAFVDPAEAKAAESSQSSVVRGWASALKGALSVPGLAATDYDVLIPVGETRPLRLTGAARGAVSMSLASQAGASGDDTVVAAPPDSDPSAAKQVVQVLADSGADDRFMLRGVTAGRDRLTFVRGGATVAVNVRVEPYAGRFDEPHAVTVTGKSVDIERVALYVASTALATAVPLDGAIARVDADVLTVALPMSDGASSSVRVPVTLTGPNMIPVHGVVTVPLRNVTLPDVSTDTLLYSNNPERITQFGTLFAARLPDAPEGAAGSTTRLLFHHQSAMSESSWFAVELLNDTDELERVHVIGGAAGPVRDTVWAGFRAGADFVRNFLSGSGLIVEIPPHSRLGLLSSRLPPNQTVSGLMQLRRLSGPAPLVRVAAQPQSDARAQAEPWQPVPLLSGELNRTGVGLAYDLSDHVYPQPVKTIEASYEIGGRWEFIGLGKGSLQATNSPGTKLYGNYGVWYDITATLHNPKDVAGEARILFMPSAGLAGGVFLVDGKQVEVPQTNVSHEPVLGTYHLAPGETRIVTIKTLPLSGSNYPARIVIRP